MIDVTQAIEIMADKGFQFCFLFFLVGAETRKLFLVVRIV